MRVRNILKSIFKSNSRNLAVTASVFLSLTSPSFSLPEKPIQIIWKQIGPIGLIRTFEGYSGTVYFGRFSKDGKYLLGVGENANQLWKTETGELIETCTGVIVLSPDDKHFLSDRMDGIINLRETETGKLVETLTAPNVEHRIHACRFSPDNKYVLVGNDDKSLKMWETETGKLVRTFNGHAKWFHSIYFSPGEKYILSQYWDNTLQLWETETGKLVRTFKAHNGEIYGVDFSSNGKYILSMGKDKTIKLWEIATGDLLRTFKDDNVGYSVKYSSDYKYILSGGKDKTIKLWETETGKLVRTFKAHNARISAVEFSPDDKYILSISEDNTAKIWETETGKLVRTYDKDIQGNVVKWASYSPNGKYILLETSGGNALRETKTDNLVLVFESGSSHFNFSADSRYILSTDKSSIKLWETETGKLLRVIDAHDYVGIDDFSPDCRYILTGEAYHVLKLWSAKILEIPDFDLLQQGLQSTMDLSKKKGFDLVSELTSGYIKNILLKYSGPKPEVPPVLTQGKYESRTEFDMRVNQAQQKFKEELQSYNEKVSEFPEELKSEALNRSFSDVFENPKVGKTQYDPESQLFALEIVPTGKQAGNFKLNLTLKAPVPRKEAESFDKALMDAKPKIMFLWNSGNFTLSEAEIKVLGKNYAAVPREGDFETTLAKVDLGSLTKNMEVSEAPKISVQYAENPELQKKSLELESLRKKKSEQERVSAMEAEIERLKGESGKSYSSDVDEPQKSFPKREQDYAVVVGIGKYDKLPEAEFAERDAAAVKKHLLALGVAEQNMVYLTGKEASLAKLTAYLEEWLPKNVSPDSRVYFYYSGHGAPDTNNGQAYLVPWDGEPSFLKSTALPLKKLYSDLGNLKTKETFVVLDACFSGAGGRSVLAKGARPLVNKIDEETGISPSITLLAAASGDEITGSIESQGHGLFTYYFLKALGDKPKKASTLFHDLKPKVESDSRRQNRIQSPVFRGPDIQIP